MPKGAQQRDWRAAHTLATPSGRGIMLAGAGFLLAPDRAQQVGLGRVPGPAKHIRPYRNAKDLASRPGRSAPAHCGHKRQRGQRPFLPQQRRAASYALRMAACGSWGLTTRLALGCKCLDRHLTPVGIFWRWFSQVTSNTVRQRPCLSGRARTWQKVYSMGRQVSPVGEWCWQQKTPWGTGLFVHLRGLHPISAAKGWYLFSAAGNCAAILPPLLRH
jgi:hypothetical protein